MNANAERFSDEWYENVGEAQDYVQLNIDDVNHINEQWQKISEHVDMGALDNQPLVDSAKQALTTEQDSSLRSLLEEAKNVPYEDVYEYLKKSQEKVDDLEDQLTQAERVVSENQEKILAQRQLIESIAPSVHDALEDVVSVEIEKVKSSELELLREELGQAKVDLEFATELFMRTGKEWPLPELADVHYEPGENEIFTIDEFPNERERTNELIKDRVSRKFESRLNDASIYLALLLKEKPGHIWTGEELGEAIYDDESDDKRNSGRISALISNYRNGKVPTMAAEFGDDLVLQRGKRQLFDAKTGKSIPNTIKVVWRLVDFETAVNAQIITTLNSERTIRQSYGEWEPADAAKIRLSRIPSGEYDGKSIVDTSQEDQENKIEDGTTSTNNAPERVDWKIDFTASVHATIEELKQAGLLEKDDISWKRLRLISESSQIGTNTMRERAFKNKIIKRSEMTDDSIISMSQVIMSVMQNSHPNVFRVSSRRKEAFRIVDEIVTGYKRAHNGN